jgi:hypothetical protein
VALRNRAGDAADTADVGWPEWEEQAAEWTQRVIETIRQLNEADAEWFATLDVVPAPRIPLKSVWYSESKGHLYAMHDFRLVKLEQLIKKEHAN